MTFRHTCRWWLAVVMIALASTSTALAQRAKDRQISAQAITQIAALQQEKASWTHIQRKIQSKLLITTKQRLRRPMAEGMPSLRPTIEIDADGMTLVDIKAKVTDALLGNIRERGGLVISSFPRFDAIRAMVPIATIEEIAAEDAIRSIRPADKAMARKVNTSEGDGAHQANVARSTYSVDGTGVKVGVLSDSVDNLATVQASGDLPAVTVLPGQAGSASGEGTAMLEIVYDLAPGADLYFAEAFSGQAQFAQNILDLQAAGCEVIVDDIFYFAEPVFQDGVIAQAISSVTAAGAVYFAAAGNEGNLDAGASGVWEGDFVEIAKPSEVPWGTAHDFGGGMNYNTITVDSPFVFALQWADPTGGSVNDYDLFLMDAALTAIYDYSANVQDGDDDPYEQIDSSSFNDTGNTLVVVKYSGADRYLHLNTFRGALSAATAGQTGGHSASADAVSVAAADVAQAGGGSFSTAHSVETFSSDGPRRMFYDPTGTPYTPGDFSSTGGIVLQKPDVTAADGVACATAGFNPFFGTSPAAAHAAAIAALLIERGTTGPAAIKQVMKDNCWDIGGAGFDRNSGYGIVNAVSAVYDPIFLPVTIQSASGGGSGQITFHWDNNGGTYTVLSSGSLITPSWLDVPGTTWPISGNMWTSPPAFGTSTKYIKIRTEKP